MSAIPVQIGRRVPVVPEMRADGPLVDTHGRVHRDLRISLTDRCSLRCTYCMPEQGNEWLARESILSVDEIVQVARVAAAAASHVPAHRRGAVAAARHRRGGATPQRDRVRARAGAVAMTTNGIRLDDALDDLIAAGLQRLNISIDTVRPERFAALTPPRPAR